MIKIILSTILIFVFSSSISAETYICEENIINYKKSDNGDILILERIQNNQFNISRIEGELTFDLDIVYDDESNLVLIFYFTDIEFVEWRGSIHLIMINKNDLTFGATALTHPFEDENDDNTSAGSCKLVN